MFVVDKEQIKLEFKNYVNTFAPLNGQQLLKVKHIKMVAQNCYDIASVECPDYKDLAWLIGICHDIGRFMQIKLYKTFKDENSIDHAQLSNQIIFEQHLIDKFLKTAQFDDMTKDQLVDIICNAVLFHNKIKVDSSFEGLMLLMCKIIRDADKIDIFRVCATDDPVDVYGGTTQQIESSNISKEVFEIAKNKQAVPYKLRKSLADDVVCHLAFIYDINFDSSIKLIERQGYFKQMLNLKFSDAKSQERFLQLKSLLPL